MNQYDNFNIKYYLDEMLSEIKMIRNDLQKIKMKKKVSKRKKSDSESCSSETEDNVMQLRSSLKRISNKYAHECESCHQKFTSQSLLNCHIKNYHIYQNFKCPHKGCLYKNNSKELCESHFQESHIDTKRSSEDSENDGKTLRNNGKKRKRIIYSSSDDEDELSIISISDSFIKTENESEMKSHLSDNLETENCTQDFIIDQDENVEIPIFQYGDEIFSEVKVEEEKLSENTYEEKNLCEKCGILDFLSKHHCKTQEEFVESDRSVKFPSVCVERRPAEQHKTQKDFKDFSKNKVLTKKCELCKKIVKASLMRKHKLDEHSLFSCNYCNFSNYNRMNLNDHLKYCHYDSRNKHTHNNYRRPRKNFY